MHEIIELFAWKMTSIYCPFYTYRNLKDPKKNDNREQKRKNNQHWDSEGGVKKFEET
jgi:hypothetical protein